MMRARAKRMMMMRRHIDGELRGAVWSGRNRSSRNQRIQRTSITWAWKMTRTRTRILPSRTTMHPVGAGPTALGAVVAAAAVAAVPKALVVVARRMRLNGERGWAGAAADAHHRPHSPHLHPLPRPHLRLFKQAEALGINSPCNVLYNNHKAIASPTTADT